MQPAWQTFAPGSPLTTPIYRKPDSTLQAQAPLARPRSRRARPRPVSEPALHVQRRQPRRSRIRLPALQRPPEDLVELGRRGRVRGAEVEPQRLAGAGGVRRVDV